MGIIIGDNLPGVKQPGVSKTGGSPTYHGFQYEVMV